MTNIAGQKYWNQVYMDLESQIADKIDPIRTWIDGNVPNADKKRPPVLNLDATP